MEYYFVVARRLSWAGTNLGVSDRNEILARARRLANVQQPGNTHSSFRRMMILTVQIVGCVARHEEADSRSPRK